MKLPRLRPGAFGGGLGLVVVAVGLLVIGIGWNGAAGAGGEINGIPTLSAQLPWLLSGGILGLGLVVFGAALVIVHNARVDRARLESKLDELVEAVGRGGGSQQRRHHAVVRGGHLRRRRCVVPPAGLPAGDRPRRRGVRHRRRGRGA